MNEKYIIMKRCYSNIFIFFVCLLSFFPSDSKADSPAAIIYEAIVPETYRNESNFTQIPAFIGGLALSVPAYIVGGAVYAFGYGIGIPIGMEKEFGLYTGGLLGFGMVRFGSTVTGAPFYLLEKTFYDAPNALLFKDQLEQSSTKEKNNISKYKTHEESQPITPGKIVKVEPLPPDSSDCKLRGIVYQENGEWKVGIYPGGSLVESHPERSECLEKQKEMDRLYVEHILKKNDNNNQIHQ